MQYDDRGYETQDRYKKEKEFRRLKKRKNIKIEETKEMVGNACIAWCY